MGARLTLLSQQGTTQEVTVTYQDDPNTKQPSYPLTTEDDSYMGWIAGAAVALAVILGIFFMTGSPTGDNVATSSPPAANMPSTTGSGTVDAPANPPTPRPEALPR